MNISIPLCTINSEWCVPVKNYNKNMCRTKCGMLDNSWTHGFAYIREEGRGYQVLTMLMVTEVMIGIKCHTDKQKVHSVSCNCILLST